MSGLGPRLPRDRNEAIGLGAMIGALVFGGLGWAITVRLVPALAFLGAMLGFGVGIVIALVVIKRYIDWKDEFYGRKKADDEPR